MPFDNAPQRELTTAEKNELDVLTRARALIENPKDWCNHDPDSSVMAPYCAMTACYTVSNGPNLFIGGPGGPFYAAALGRLLEHAPGLFSDAKLPIAAFNDHPDTTHAAVLDLFDRAIAKLLVP